MRDDASDMVSVAGLIGALLLAGIAANVIAVKRAVGAEIDDGRHAVRIERAAHRTMHRAAHRRAGLRADDPRPGAWCGWWLRQQLGVADRLYNLARAWAHFGSAASGPAPGVIAVYPHHVGIVTAVPGAGRIVLKSGNDGHAVRERERSARGVIAWRWPSSQAEASR